ncbi:MAG: hypothetical protein K2L70_03985 [Clostridia bacterium]|nr:hypothetical protein [Clostridia bacterium]
MWLLYLVFAMILMLYCIIFLIAYGIKFVFRLDLNNMSVCFKCYILDWIEVLCIKTFVCNGVFYYQINKKPIKTVSENRDTDIKKQNKRSKKSKLKIGAYISRLWSKLPNIKIRRLSINYGASFEEIKGRALLDGCAMLISNTLMAVSGEKLRLQEFELQNISQKSNLNGVDVECVLGFSIIKIAAYVIYAMTAKKKYEVAI